MDTLTKAQKTAMVAAKKLQIKKDKEKAERERKKGSSEAATVALRGTKKGRKKLAKEIKKRDQKAYEINLTRSENRIINEEEQLL